MAKLRASSIGRDLAIAQGYVSGYRSFRKFGINRAVGTTFEEIWSAGGPYNWLQAASAVRIKAGGASTDDAASTGALEITVNGLDEDWNEASETIVTAGASASAPTTTTFIRVYRAYVSQTGTYTGANDGDIDVETTGGTLVARVTEGLGQTLMAITSVPAKHTLWLTRFRVIVGDTNKEASVCIHKRDRADVVTPPFGVHRTMATFDRVVSGNSANVVYQSYSSVPEKSDLWIRANTTSGTASVSAGFDYILTRNPPS